MTPRLKPECRCGKGRLWPGCPIHDPEGRRLDENPAYGPGNPDYEHDQERENAYIRQDVDESAGLA